MIIATNNIKKAIYLLTFFGLFTFIACTSHTSDSKNQVMVCPNTESACLPDHSCCLIKEETETDDTNSVKSEI